MRSAIFISVFILFLFTGATAQQQNNAVEDTTEQTIFAPKEEVVEAPVNDTLYIDTTLYYNQLRVERDSILKWKNTQAFSYVNYLDSLIKARQKQEKEREPEEDKSISQPSWIARLFNAGFFQVLIWTIAAAFVLFILYKLFLTEGAFRKKTTAQKKTTAGVEEEIITPESDFERMIREAAQSGNYRLAVRYQYLQALHKLAAKNLLSLAADKTNYQYVREITRQDIQHDFAALTLNYEYVWYGEFAIEENIYRQITTGFSQFNNKF